MDDVEVIRVGTGVAVVALHGEHDTMTREELCSLLSSEVTGNRLVVIDVTDAGFIDSSVVHNLIKVDRLARDQGSHVVLQMDTARVGRRAIEVSGILNSVEWAGSRESALGGSTKNRPGHVAAVTADG